MPDDQSTDYRAEARRELNGWLTNWGPTIEAMIADLAIPIYTHELMACAAESAEIFAGPDDRGLLEPDATPERQISVALYELASNIAVSRVADRIRSAS